MNKSTNFSGIPVINQILKYILPTDISRTAEKYNSDRYYKKFKTYDHLVTMIYATLSGVSSSIPKSVYEVSNLGFFVTILQTNRISLSLLSQKLCNPAHQHTATTQPAPRKIGA